MKAVVIGASGQIGGWLMWHLAERGHVSVGTYSTVGYPGLVELRAGEAGATEWLLSEAPDVVFYPAGFTWVDGCERDPQRAMAANRDEPMEMARASALCGARFVSFSTDYVFDGGSGPYVETDAVAPLNVYGQAKVDAERLMTEEFGDQVLIARTCWVYGPERQGKNFAYQLVRNLEAGKGLVCPSDQWANPSYGPDVALGAVMLAEAGVSGVIHLAGPEFVNRVRFAEAVARAFGLDASRIEGRLTEEMGQGAARPLRGGLRSDRAEAMLGSIMRPMALALVDFDQQVGPGRPWLDPRS